MVKRIFRSIFFTSLAAVILASVFITFILYEISESDAIQKLKTEAAYISELIKQIQTDPDYLQYVYPGDRITVIDENGDVLYDNMSDASSMENHADRPEIAEALKSGTGESSRYSNTLSQMTIYFATRLNDGNILRLSKTQNSVFGLLWDVLPILFIIIISIAMLSLLVARYLAKNISAPLNKMNLDSPFENELYDELSPLLIRIEHQNKEIKNHLSEITEKQREFNLVTENMREGLILLSAKGTVLSINKSAVEIFRTELDKCIGSHILSVNRSVSMHKVFEGVINEKNTEALLTLNNRQYQLLGNPVVSKGSALGAMILLLDVTDRQNAERSRREFSANVTHELKTPLTSILGFAEIMKTGLTKPEDMRDFAGRIHDEAGRLLTLIDDILELSRLDEKKIPSEKEQVDLYYLVEDVINRLKPLADKNEVDLSVHGDHIKVYGYGKILNEMLYNMCDNAIKYNIKGGSVDVKTEKKEGKPIVTVSDTGIGIPAEHLSHIFERFYRVDKSRSKDIGGTGLGLSIVKHGAALHEATIEIESEENKGTTFTLVFPRSDETCDESRRSPYNCGRQI